MHELTTHGPQPPKLLGGGQKRLTAIKTPIHHYNTVLIGSPLFNKALVSPRHLSNTLSRLRHHDFVPFLLQRLLDFLLRIKDPLR